MFEIIPAIDVRGGSCVRLFRGRFDAETIYSDDSVAVAKQWEREGAPRLHVVDLDGAREGKPGNLEIITTIVRSVTIPAQVGGGIRSEAIVEHVLSLGVERVVVGTRAGNDSDFVRRIAEQWGDRLIVGIDTKGGRVAVQGWQNVIDLSAVEMSKKMEQLGVRRIIFTDIERDGALQGPNIRSLREVTEAVNIPVVASGGISSVDDILAVSKVEGVEGVIIGKALYEGNLNLRDALSSFT